MDRILMEGMSFVGHHGVHPAEREMGAHFTVDAELEFDLTTAGTTDRLEDTVDYEEAFERVRAVVEDDTHHLIETVAQRIAAALLALDHVQRAKVTVRKRPYFKGEYRWFGAEVTRSR